MNKKGLSGIAILGIAVLVIIIIVGVVTFLIVRNQIPNPLSQNVESKSDKGTTLYLDAYDSNGNPMSANYVLFSPGFFSGAIYGGVFTEINNVSNNSLMNYSDGTIAINNTNLVIYCSQDGYYSDLIYKNFDSFELSQNISKVDCVLNQSGSLRVYSKGNLTNGNSFITLGIYADGSYENLEICSSWSAGISDVQIDGVPGNYTIPDRYRNKVDRCFYLGQNLHNSNTQVNFQITSTSLNAIDSVNFYIFDNDLVYTSNRFQYLSEYNGVNVGNPMDSLYQIKPNI